jgi:hypothetical protein
MSRDAGEDRVRFALEPDLGDADQLDPEQQQIVLARSFSG